MQYSTLSVASAAACDDQPLRVAVDIGHSPSQPGTESATGRLEYDFNARFSKELVAQSGRYPSLQLYLLDAAASGPELLQRTKRASDTRADIFISIHHDSVNDRYLKAGDHAGKKVRFTDAFKGYSLFVSAKNAAFDKSSQIAELIGRQLKAAGQYPALHHAEPISGENRRLLNWELGIYDAPFAVLTSAKMPAILIEVGVISNKIDEQLLEVAEYRGSMQSAILGALNAYCQP